MTLFSKSYIPYGVKVLRCVLSSGAVCIFSRTDRSWARLCGVYPKSAKSTAIEYTEEVLLCAGEMRIHYFSGQVFFVLQTKMVIASGSRNNVSLCHSPRHLLPGGEPCISYMVGFGILSKSKQRILNRRVV